MAETKAEREAAEAERLEAEADEAALHSGDHELGGNPLDAWIDFNEQVETPVRLISRAIDLVQMHDDEAPHRYNQPTLEALTNALKFQRKIEQEHANAPVAAAEVAEETGDVLP